MSSHTPSIEPRPAAWIGRPGEEPNWPAVEAELADRGASLTGLWLTYSQQRPDALSYSWFCRRYKRWRRLAAVGRRHVAGARAFCSLTKGVEPLLEPGGVAGEVELFVAVLGASRLVYAAAWPITDLKAWVDGHARYLAAIGGAPRAIIWDHPWRSSGSAPAAAAPLRQACRTFEKRFGVRIVPIAGYRKIENDRARRKALVIARWLKRRLADRRFASVEALNQAIGELVEQANQRPSRLCGRTAVERYRTLEAPALRPLPQATEPVAMSTARASAIKPSRPFIVRDLRFQFSFAL